MTDYDALRVLAKTKKTNAVKCPKSIKEIKHQNVSKIKSKIMHCGTTSIKWQVKTYEHARAQETVQQKHEKICQRQIAPTQRIPARRLFFSAKKVPGVQPA